MPEAGTWTAGDVRDILHVPTDDDHKYSRGVLGMRTGSAAYPGAAVLGVEAAWRTGLGMVRYLGDAPEAVLRRRPETVTAPGRVQAWVVGSGTDAETRTPAQAAAIRAALAGAEPVVVDAGALDLAPGAAAPIVVTPHALEHARLRELLGLGAAEPAGTQARADAAAETAGALGGVVLLKGADTIVAAPGRDPVVVRAGTPWLATAGTGDVLAGVIGALAASAAAHATVDLPMLARLAASGAWLHGRAGVRAVEDAGGGPVTALDVAEALPRTIGAVLAGGR